jgi:hydroxymethylbilane synthase
LNTPNPDPIALGTRGSELALVQSNLVRELLLAVDPNLRVELKIIKTTGDKRSRASLSNSGVKGLFTKELEEALLNEQIELAVHSLKDMLTELPSGLILSAVLQRESPLDVLIGQEKTPLTAPAVVYTSSPRRAMQARRLWPGAEIREMRGNVGTRLEKVAQGRKGEALILAAAGLRRLGYLKEDSSKVSGILAKPPFLPYRVLSLEEMIPAPGQAAIGMETRVDHQRVQTLLAKINHQKTWHCVRAERAFLRELGGGCATPVGAHAFIKDDRLQLDGIVGSDAGKAWRGGMYGAPTQDEQLGTDLARECKAALGANLAFGKTT